uniref:Uncharacterized protein n=1 Tax=Globisporangium ultimum (strain ATCC 200006 / CBS 805.95 / DAOM BR144) TaxID=431595 RepID=K3W7X7_GLOUD
MTSAPHHAALNTEEQTRSTPDNLDTTSSVTALSVDSSSPGTIAYYASVSDQSRDDDDEEDTERRISVKKPKKLRSGWGRFRSVLRERSVDFNLTLDIQNLKQEIQTMENFRDILVSKTLIQRHDRNGSLARTVHEYYRILVTGLHIQQTGRKRMINEKDQKEFMYSIIDKDIDIGNGVTGIETLIKQFELYSMFIKQLGITMTSFDVILLDDTVLVATKGIMRFQILRNTIAGMFPHIISEEWLVSQLVGQSVAAESTIDFHFNKNGQVSKMDVGLDLVKCFAELLKDPKLVDILLGRAMIAEDWYIIPNDDMPNPDSILPVPKSPTNSVSSGSASGFDGDTDGQHVLSPPSPAPSEQSVDVASPQPRTDDNTEDPLASESTRRNENLTTLNTPSSTTTPRSHAQCSPRHSGPMTPVDHFSHIVRKYFQIFANGSHSNADEIADFLDQYFSLTVGYGSAVGRLVIEERWRSLCWCFDLVSFCLVSQKPVVYQPHLNEYHIRAKAEYALQITARTLELVFPHVIPTSELVDALVGSVIVVDAHLSFALDRGSGLVSSLRERMDFRAALNVVVKDPADLAFVLSRDANRILMSYAGEIDDEGQTDATNQEPHEQGDTAALPRVSSPDGARSHDSEDKMSISSVLN